jgi:hypothetical protein
VLSISAPNQEQQQDIHKKPKTNGSEIAHLLTSRYPDRKEDLKIERCEINLHCGLQT